MGKTTVFLVLSCAAVLSAVGCGPSTPGAEAPSREAAAGPPGKAQERWGKPVVVDTFERAELGDAWRIVAGKCEIKEGRLVATADGGFYLLSATKLPGDVAIEFDGMIADAQKACDLAAALSASDSWPKDEHYRVCFGSDGNTASTVRVRRSGGTSSSVVAREAKKFTPGKWHRVRAEREGATLRLFVDGRKILEHTEAAPFSSEGHNGVGLHTWGGPTHFDNVKIYRKQSPTE